MNFRLRFLLTLLAIVCCVRSFTQTNAPVRATAATKHLLYVAVPGIRDYLGYGGHGLLVFDIDNNHQFVKRIPLQGLHPDGKPSNVKGIAVSIPLNSVYVSTLEGLQRIDLTSERIVWEKKFEGGCDRMAVSPDGMTMYLPSLEKGWWNVVECKTGNLIKKIPVHKRAHNTIYSTTGNTVYLDDIGSSWLYVADARTHSLSGKIGPFNNFVRPFTVNGEETLAYVTVDSLLGFEVGDIRTGKKIAHVEVEGWEPGPVRRHGNPSHGIGLTPDEKELWLCDGHNMRMHVFSAVPPYQQLTTISVQDMPGWINFSANGKYAYPSSGEVIDVKTRKILMTLSDENHNSVASEKMLEIDFADDKAVDATSQFAVGQISH